MIPTKLKDFISLGDYEIRHFDEIDEAIEKVKKVVPGLQIHWLPGELNMFYMNISFSDITIENRLKMQYYIGDVDLNVHMCFKYITPNDDNKPKLKIKVIKTLGAKVDHSKGMIAAGYNHSHLQVGKDSPKGVCFGGDTPLAKAYGSILSAFTPDNLIAFLMELNTWVRWESEEGVPYIHHKDAVRYDGLRSTNGNFDTPSKRKHQNYQFRFLSWIYTSGKNYLHLYLKSPEMREQLAKKYLVENKDPEIYRRGLLRAKSGGRWLRQDQLSERSNREFTYDQYLRKFSKIPFAVRNGQIRMTKPIQRNNSNDEVQKDCVSPLFIEYLNEHINGYKSKIEEEQKYEARLNAFREKYGESEPVSPFYANGTIPVPEDRESGMERTLVLQGQER